jgi:hypothetical protein
MSQEKQFNEKLKLLNEDFVDFVSSAFQENPFYDFTPSVTDYIKHVKELDVCYSDKPVERKIIVAKRKVTTPAVKSVQKSKETSKPIVPEPKKLSNGLVEPTGQFDFAPKVQMPAIPSAAATTNTPVFSAPKSIDQPTPPSQSRKRRQEPLDYDDMRNKSSDDYGKAEKHIDTPRPPPATNNSLFSGLNKSGETLNFNPGNVVKESEPAKTTPSNDFLFGGLNKTGGTPSFNFGNKESEASQPAASSNPLFGGLAKSGGTFNFTSGKPEKESESPQTIQSNNSLFGSSGKPGATLSFNFGNKDSEPSKTTPTSNSLFGALVKPSGTFTFNSGKSDKESESPQTLPSSTTLFSGLVKPGGLFNFKAPETSTPTSTATNGESNNKDNGEEGDAEDAPPPKIEIIKHEEPGAVFSTKCSLFNFVNNEYKKVGIGFLHIKKSDSGTQLLIRAATALGTVWINTYINSSFKAEKKNKDKIQFSYPSTEGAKTSLVRVVDVDDAVAYLTGVKKP